MSHYNKLIDILAQFKQFLSPRKRLEWNEQLNSAFERSKIEIINAIKEGVRIFYINRLTCLHPDWSKTGISYFLSQKYCNCKSLIPECYQHDWRITLAGSQYLKPAETRYAAVEGGALAIAWLLEQTRFFTQGYDNLVVVTDHKSLMHLFSYRTLDQITNSRLFSLKQRTLPWRFTVHDMPGKGNCFSDAA